MARAHVARVWSNDFVISVYDIPTVRTFTLAARPRRRALRCAATFQAPPSSPVTALDDGRRRLCQWIPSSCWASPPGRLLARFAGPLLPVRAPCIPMWPASVRARPRISPGWCWLATSSWDERAHRGATARRALLLLRPVPLGLGEGPPGPVLVRYRSALSWCEPLAASWPPGRPTTSTAPELVNDDAHRRGGRNARLTSG